MPQLKAIGHAVRHAQARRLSICAQPPAFLLVGGGAWPTQNCQNSPIGAEEGRFIRRSQVTARHSHTTKGQSRSAGNIKETSKSQPQTPFSLGARETGPTTIEEFLKLAADGHATVDDATFYLASEKSRIEALPADEREQAAAKAGGGHVLNWLWTNRIHHKTKDFENRSFCDLLCWFLVPEGLEELIVKWVELECAAFKAKLPELPMGIAPLMAGNPIELLRHELGWIRRICAGLIHAKIAWAPSGDMTDALRSLHLFSQLPALQGLRRFKVLLHAAIGVAKPLDKIECPPCDPELFDWFYDKGLALAHSREVVADRKPRLILYHPTSPNADPWLNFTHTHVQQHGSVLHMVTKQAHLNNIAIASLRAVYILRARGNSEGADFLENLVREDSRFHLVWRVRRRLYRDLEADPKLQMLRR